MLLETIFIETIIFDAIMTMVTIGAVIFAFRKKSVWSSLLAVGIVGVSILVLTPLLEQSKFGAIRLLAYGGSMFFPAALVSVALLGRHGSRWLATGYVLVAVIVIGVSVDTFFIEPDNLEVTHIEIASEKIKEPIRIVLIADLQTDKIKPYEERMMQLVKKEKPDLVLWAGDYIQVRSAEAWEREFNKMNELCRQTELNPRLGVYAVGGNVDSGNWGLMFKDLGWNIVNRTETFHLDGIDLTCLSMNDSFRPTVQVDQTEQYHVVLGHAPAFARGCDNADLMLAGHTHGGQIYIPGFGAIMTMSGVPRQWANGMTKMKDGRTLVVSRGVGCERGRAPRIRFCCRPELVVIDLVPEKRRSLPN